MRQIINRFLLFMLIMIGLLSFYSLASRLALRNKIAPKSFLLPPEIETVIMGDSHTASALDPAIVKNSINLSFEAEHYFLTYYKLKRILAANSAQVKTVIVGCSYHNFSSASDRLLWELVPDYFRLLDVQGILALKKRDFNYIRIFLAFNLGFPTKGNIVLFAKTLLGRHDWSHFPFMGYFYHSETSNLNDATVAFTIHKQYYPEGAPQGFSTMQLKYLLKICDLCQEKGINTILFNGPLHPSYVAKIPGMFIDHYDKTIQDLAQRRGFFFLDYSRQPMIDSCYGDGDHANYFGAQIISPLVAADLVRIGRHGSS